jgi:tetratricopeptide (TPR) repeat protein
MKKTALSTAVFAVVLAVAVMVWGMPERMAAQQEREWFSRGQEAVAFGKYEEAIRCFEKVLSINPGFVDGYRFMGDVYMKQGMPDSAIAAYKKALDAKPQQVPALIGLGTAYYQKDMIDESQASYARAVTMQPDSAPARIGLGDIYYYKKGDTERALTEYLKGLALEPDHAEAQLNAGVILQKGAERDRAAHHFYKAGMIFLNRGDSKNAFKAYEYLQQTNQERLIQLLHDALEPSVK